jgi:hypothetical protein
MMLLLSTTSAWADFGTIALFHRLRGNMIDADRHLLDGGGNIGRCLALRTGSHGHLTGGL